MNKKDFELLNIEVGTFKKLHDQLTLKIDKSQFRYDSISELNEMKSPEPNFLPLKNITEEENHVVLTYGLLKNAKSLKELPKERKAIRTAIAKEIMHQNILENQQYQISLNPANIWYYPMNHVWYAYRANELMPFDNQVNKLVRIKALILYCLTGTPYERLLNNLSEAMPKKQDELIEQIIQANDVEELTLAIDSIDDYVSYEEWKEVELKEKKLKTKLIIAVTLVTLIGLTVIGFVHKNDQNKYNALKQQQQTEIAELKYSTQVTNALNNKEWDKADKAMDKAGYSKEKKAKTYLKLNQYQRALNADPGLLLTIVKQAYKNGDSKDILDWQTPSEASEKNKEQLKLEKAIINYDVDTLTGELSFEQNPDVLLRMGKAFNNNGDTQNAQTVQTKLKEVDKDKGAYLNALMNLRQAEKTVEDSQNKLDSANKINKKDKNKANKVKEAKSNLENAKKDQNVAQKKVDELKKKVGD